MQDPSTEGPGLTPGQGTRSQMPQLKVCMPQRKIPHVTSKTQHSQKKKKKGPLQGQGVNVVPGLEPGWAPSQPRHPAPAPPWEVSGRGLWGTMGRGAHVGAGNQFCSMPFIVSGTSERSRASITQGDPGGGELRHHPLPPSVLHTRATSGRPPHSPG